MAVTQTFVDFEKNIDIKAQLFRKISPAIPVLYFAINCKIEN
jgi:hypothetical protein